MDKRSIAKSVILPPGDQSIDSLEMCERFPGGSLFCNFDRQNASGLSTAYFDFQLEQYKALGCRFSEWTTRIPWEDPAALALLEACKNRIPRDVSRTCPPATVTRDRRDRSAGSTDAETLPI